MNEEFQIEVYETETGKLPYSEWENHLSAKDRAIITTRLVRIDKEIWVIANRLGEPMVFMNSASILGRDIGFTTE